MFIVRTHVLACCFVVVAAWATSCAHAAEPMTLADALAKVLRDSPDLRMYSYHRRIAEAEKLQAGLRPNPQLGVTLENFGGTGEVRGVRALETTLSLSQVIELGDKRGLRVETALATMDNTLADYAVTRLDVLSETARRFVDVVEAQATVELAKRSIELADRTREVVERRIQAGAASTVERNRATIGGLRAQLDLQQAQSVLEAKRLALAALWGGTTLDVAEVSGDLAALATLADFQTLSDKLQDSPTFARFASERRLREAEVKLAKAQATPDLTMSAGVRRLASGSFGGSADYGLVASLNLPLPIFNRNQGNVAAAEARVDQNDAAREQALLRIRTVLYGLFQANANARRQAETMRLAALPEAEQALLLTQNGFSNGRFSLLELIDAQRQVLEVRRQIIQAQADAHRLDAEIERLTGEPATDSTSVPTQPLLSGASQ